MAKRVFKKDLKEYVEKLNTDELPRHIAIIMDGNGRWAKKRGLARSFGHRAGTDNVKKIIRFCSDIGIKILTLFAFSTENWKRPAEEVNLLMGLLLEYLRKEIRELNEENVVLNTLGNISELSKELIKEINDAKELTKNNTGMKVNIAINYGARTEIVKAAADMAGDVCKGKLKPEDINEEKFSAYLYTDGMDDPDMVIRTSGETRISNFLLYQSAYAEYIFTDILWPDLNEKELAGLILEYQSRHRRYGGI